MTGLQTPDWSLQIQPGWTSWHLRQRYGFSDVFVLAPDPSPQLPGQLLHQLVSSFLFFLHRRHKSHRRQRAWAQTVETLKCNWKSFHNHGNNFSLSTPEWLIQAWSHHLIWLDQSHLPFSNMASKGSAGGCTGTLKYSDKRFRSLVMYLNLFGTRPGGLLPLITKKS